MTEQIKKGLSFAAFGFLFVLVNINLNFNDTSINIMPEFIGWILFFLAFDRLGSYTAGRKYLKWISFFLIILTAVQWLLAVTQFFSYETDMLAALLPTIIAILSTFYFFMFFASLVDIARDFNSPRADTLHFLRWFNLIVELAFLGMSLLYIATGNASATLTLVLGVAALVSAIATAVTLFGLRKDVRAVQAE